MMAVRTIAPDIVIRKPGVPRGKRRPAPAVWLALFLPLMLAACDGADEESAPPPGEETDAGVTAEDSGPAAPDGAKEPGPTASGGAEDALPVVEVDNGAISSAGSREEPAPDVAGAPDAGEAPDAVDALPAAPTYTIVRALDKITARVTELVLPQDHEVRFGTLAIRARTCRSRPPEEPPETFAFLEIDDVKGGVDAEFIYKRVFAGWMMASSPALNALEHPVYDVWVIACRTAAAGASSSSE